MKNCKKGEVQTKIKKSMWINGNIIWNEKRLQKTYPTLQFYMELLDFVDFFAYN